MTTQPVQAAPRKVLARLPTWVGDVVMATPALRALARAHPDAELVVEGRAHQRELVEGLPGVDRFLVDPGKGVRATWRRVRALRRERFDWAVLFPDSQRAALAPWLARVPVRAGYARDLARRLLTTHRLQHPSAPDGSRLAFSMVERYLRITRMLGCPDDGDRMEVPVSADARARVEARLADLGAEPGRERLYVCAGASYGASKLWPPEHFARACDRIVDDHGLLPVLAPGPGEEELARDVAGRMERDAVVVADPGLSLGELAALIEGSRLALSNDTGPRSVAVALGVPTVVLIGPTHTGHTDHHLERQRVLREDVDCSPYSQPCGLKRCPIDHRCMVRLDPERAVAAASELLRAFPASTARSVAP